MDYKELTNRVNKIFKDTKGAIYDSKAIEKYSESLESFYKENEESIHTDDLLRLYKQRGYNSEQLSNNANSLLTGMGTSAIILIVDSIAVCQSLLVGIIGLILMMIVVVWTLLTNILHSKEKNFYYNNVHKSIIKKVLEKRGLADAL